LKFVVLASNSFSGSHFVRQALSQGAEVLGVSRSDEVPFMYRAYAWSGVGKENFRFLKLDLNDDLSPLMKTIQDFAPTHVVNFAAQSMVGESWTFPEHWYETNVVALSRLTSELKKLSTLEKYVHVTTPEVYGNTPGWVTERYQSNPSTPYAISRATGDMHLKALHKEFDFPVVFTRAANVYGAGQRFYRIVPKAAYCALRHERLPLHGGGRSMRCFIHVKDVAEATWILALQATAGATYHISTREAVSIREVVDKVFKAAGQSSEKLLDITEDRIGKDQNYLLDSSLIREAFGFEPRVSLEEGIAEVIDWTSRYIDQVKTSDLTYAHRP
jgi:dTDP-glucose 4,6-dehydratase